MKGQYNLSNQQIKQHASHLQRGEQVAESLIHDHVANASMFYFHWKHKHILDYC